MPFNTRIVLNRARAAFPNFVEPQPHPSDKSPNPKKYYNCNYLIPKTETALIESIRNAELQAIADKFTNGNTDKAKPIHEAAKAIGKVCLHDGDLKPDWDGYPGHYYVSARTESTRGRPEVYGLQGKNASLPNGGQVPPETIYGGCYVRAVFNVFGYGGRDGIQKGAAAGLGAVQFIGDGDSFGARPPTAKDDEFGSIDAPAENDPLAS